ncbi:MAG: hypothetical protein ACPGXK_08640 [Phycisphaerae bacterium]
MYHPLTVEEDAFVEEPENVGRYACASEAFWQGLRLLQYQEKSR